MKNVLIFIVLSLQIIKCISDGSKSKHNTDHHIVENIKNDNISSKELPELLGTPEALIRYRHDLPITIIKHKTQKIRRRPKPIVRRRVKQPKTKYGPPGYSFGEPLSHYKPLDVYENYQSDDLSTHFTGGSRYNEYESFYKELGPDFNFEDVTFSEYDKQPIKINLYDKKSYRKISQNKLNHGKIHENDKTKLTPPHWSDIKTSFSSDDDEDNTYDIPEENPWDHITKYKKALRKPYKELKAPIPKETSWEQYKEVKQEFKIPHTKYGVPFTLEEDEYELPKKTIKNHFAEPPEQKVVYNTHTNSGGYHTPKNNKKPHSSFYGPTKSYPIDATYEPPQFVQPPEEKNKNNGYFAEPPTTGNTFKYDGTYYPEFQQELPLQNDGKSRYNFPKSSYDVPLYDSMPFKDKVEPENNYPPLGGTHFMPPEVQGSPSKISLRYAAKNATLTPTGYFSDSPTKNTKSKENLRENSSEHFKTNKQNRTRRRKIKNRSSTELIPAESVETKNTYAGVFNTRIKKKIENIENTDLIDNENSTPFTTSIPLNFLLLSSANRNPGSHISSSQWDPMKVTTYSFKIDHSNISASIPNVKTKEQSEEKIITTTPLYKRRYKPRKNRNFKGVELISIQKSKSRKIYAGTVAPDDLIRKEIEIVSRDDRSTSDENDRDSNEYVDDSDYEDEVIVQSNYNINDENERRREISTNLKLIRDPFDYKEKKNNTNTENHQLRYKNHRYY